MSKLLRLGAAGLLAASGLVASATASSADPIEVVDCDAPVHNPGVGTPGADPVPGIDVLSENDNCAELVRTLVFVGNAEIDNGVNFNGVGGTSPGTHGTPIDPNGGGTYLYEGDCVMVQWEDPRASSVPTVDPVPSVVDCEFGTVDGQYYTPTSPQPIVAGVFGPLSDGVDDHHAGAGAALNWAPAGTASCFSSSGEGIADFTSTTPLGPETWVSDYSWTNSLNNLRGTVSGPSGTFLFDAKIEAHANTAQALSSDGDGLLDATDAGCLQKPLNDLQGQASNARTGLNHILIVGTATWDLRAPVLFP